MNDDNNRFLRDINQGRFNKNRKFWICMCWPSSTLTSRGSQIFWICKFRVGHDQGPSLLPGGVPGWEIEQSSLLLVNTALPLCALGLSITPPAWPQLGHMVTVLLHPLLPSSHHQVRPRALLVNNLQLTVKHGIDIISTLFWFQSINLSSQSICWSNLIKKTFRHFSKILWYK